MQPKISGAIHVEGNVMMQSDAMKLVIAYDGSEPANTALDDLRNAGLPNDANALVVSVTDSLLPPPPLSAYEFVERSLGSRRAGSLLMEASARASQALEEARSTVFEGMRRVHQYFPDWKVTGEGMVGSPTLAVMQKAEDWKADLIVAGSHGRSALGRFFLGSVSRTLAHEACYSVRVARSQSRTSNTPLRLLVGVDGSSGAEQAVRAVGTRVWPVGTEVRLITVNSCSSTGIAGVLPIPYELISRCEEQDPAAADRMLEWAESELRLIGLNISTEIKEGDPQRILIEEAKEWKADSIFVGAHGHNSRPEDFQAGKVAMAVTTGAHCSVEVVRATRVE